MVLDSASVFGGAAIWRSVPGMSKAEQKSTVHESGAVLLKVKRALGRGAGA